MNNLSQKTVRESLEQEEQAEKNKGAFSFLTDRDWRYGVWKAGVVWTDRSFLYLFAYVILSFLVSRERIPRRLQRGYNV